MLPLACTRHAKWQRSFDALGRLRLPVQQEQATTFRMDLAMQCTGRRYVKVSPAQAMLIERDIALEHDTVLGLIMRVTTH